MSAQPIGETDVIKNAVESGIGQAGGRVLLEQQWGWWRGRRPALEVALGGAQCDPGVSGISVKVLMCRSVAPGRGVDIIILII